MRPAASTVPPAARSRSIARFQERAARSRRPPRSPRTARSRPRFRPPPPSTGPSTATPGPESRTGPCFDPSPALPETLLTSPAVRNDRLLAAVAVVIGIALIVVGVIYLVQNEH